MRLRSVFTNSFGILLSRITGLFRDILMASALGASVWSDMFFVAFKIPNLFRRIFAEGAFTQAFMPSFIASRHKGVFSVAIFVRFMLFLVLLSLLVSYFPDYVTKAMAWGWNQDKIALTAPLTAINFWYLDLIFIVTFIATLLQYKEHFATTALSTALLNLSMIAALWLYIKKDPQTVAYALSVAVVVGGFLQVIAHIIALKRFRLDKILVGGWRYRRKKTVEAETKNFFKLFFPSVLGNSTPQIASFIDTLLATFISAGAVSYLFYANRIFQLPLALFAIATSVALFPSVSKALQNRNEAKAYASLSKAFWFLTFLLTLATLGGIFLAKPIVWLLFERGKFTAAESFETAYVLQMYLIGLLPYGLAKLFSLFLYASQRHKKAAKIAFYSLLATVASSLLLMHPMRSAGLALAGSIGGWVLFFFTLKEMGFNRFFAILEEKYSILYLVTMPLAGACFYGIGDWLTGLIYA